MKRPTIADVAKRAGVTKAAVSFALNDQPGVSAATRERILAIAAEVGFQPSSAASHLVGLGHRRIGHVTGIARYWHTKSRTDALSQIAAEAGIEITSIEADDTGEFGARATREMLRRPDPPTAIFYDNDVMAVAGLGEAQRMGVAIPADLSIMAWDDSMLCELVHPALTALRRDIAAVGSEAARRLSLMATRGGVAEFQEPPPVLMARASTAPPRS